MIEQMQLVTGPTVNRHNSEQVVATPWSFMLAVKRKFGPVVVDLAATDENHKAPIWITPEQDTFKKNWAELLAGGLGWLNPEFDPMVTWVAKCAMEQRRGAELLALAPASIGSNWFWDHVQPYATVYSVGRIPFVGSHNLYPPKHKRGGQRKCGPECEGCCPYPKDLILNHYCQNPSHELQRWDWRRS